MLRRKSFPHPREIDMDFPKVVPLFFFSIKSHFVPTVKESLSVANPINSKRLESDDFYNSEATIDVTMPIADSVSVLIVPPRRLLVFSLLLSLHRSSRNR